MTIRALAVTMLLLTVVALAAVLAGEGVDVARRGGETRPAPAPSPPRVTELPTVAPTPSPSPRARIAWRKSRALGLPYAGRLVRGVRLPAGGPDFVTWDPVRRRSPNRPWRRHGTDRLVRMVLRVARGYASAHPRAPRLVVGDLSRPHGGDFGARYGGIGHSTHQNGLDADVYLPRRDGRERAPRKLAQVDRARAQDLVDRFVRAGAAVVLVGPDTGLEGPAGVVKPWPNHNDHLHVRLPAG
jgi:murein endopeptidase